MKNVLAIAALFAAVTVGASAQYDNGASTGSGAHTVGGASGITHTSMDDANNAGFSKATATIRTEVVENVTVSYLNTPIDIVGNVGYGTQTPMPSEHAGATPTFFLIQNETASFNNFAFTVRGSENASVQLDWAVTPTGTSVQLQSANAVMTVNDASDVDPSSTIASTVTTTQNDNTADVGTGAMGGVFSNSTSYGASGGHLAGSQTTPNVGAAGEPWFGGNQYDQTGPIGVKISFTVKAITEGAEGVENPTSFEVSLKATNYTLLGDVASI